jgi:L-cysteine desulfidase
VHVLRTGNKGIFADTKHLKVAHCNTTEKNKLVRGTILKHIYLIFIHVLSFFC